MVHRLLIGASFICTPHPECLFWHSITLDKQVQSPLRSALEWTHGRGEETDEEVDGAS